jgi:NADH-quinone oxidoreductase subunit A
MSPTSLVAYLALFAAVAFLFLFVSLLLGRLLRANVPTPEKLATYECGEPPVGSSFVQFDLRFYVVALVFIVFEVELALFFPPAVVFGQATQRMQSKAATTAADQRTELWDDAESGESPETVASDARLLALAAMADLGVFFAVILVGFAFVWWRGDLNWVRAIGREGLRIEGSELRVSA